MRLPDGYRRSLIDLLAVGSRDEDGGGLADTAGRCSGCLLRIGNADLVGLTNRDGSGGNRLMGTGNANLVRLLDGHRGGCIDLLAVRRRDEARHREPHLRRHDPGRN